MGTALIRRRCVSAIAVVVAMIGFWPSTAAAVEMSSERVRELARLAPADPQALRQLMDVTSVDGRPMRIGDTLRGADGADLAARLSALADGPSTADVDAAVARERASEILSEPRFRDSTTLPRPFRGLLERIGDRLEVIADAVAGVLPGGRATFWTIVAGVVVAVAVFVALRVARRRVTVAGHARAEARLSTREDPKELERQADAAEQAGDIERAVRLRFRAGLLRLDAAGAISYHPSITTGEVRRRIRLRSFSALARRFEEIAYGGRPAEPGDAEAARATWPKVLEEVGSTWQRRG